MFSIFLMIMMTMVMMQLMAMMMMMLMTMMMMTNYLRIVPPMISVVSRVLAEPTKNDPAVLHHNHRHHDYHGQIIITTIVTR